MDVFNSQWLLNMLAKSSKTPQGRILSLFDILDDWLQAPNIQLDIANSRIPNQKLIAFCTEQAKACGAENPAMLAEHIVLIARNAAQQEINHPGSNSLVHAKKAANALILAQTQKEWLSLTLSNKQLAAYGIAASVFVIIGVAVMWLPVLMQNTHAKIPLAKNSVKTDFLQTVTLTPANNGLTAGDAAAMYAKYEQMRNGTCQFPEVLQIPDKDKMIYIENVVGGKLPTSLVNLAIANTYLEKVRCNFTPMLMAHSK